MKKSKVAVAVLETWSELYKAGVQLEAAGLSTFYAEPKLVNRRIKELLLRTEEAVKGKLKLWGNAISKVDCVGVFPGRVVVFRLYLSDTVPQRCFAAVFLGDPLLIVELVRRLVVLGWKLVFSFNL